MNLEEQEDYRYSKQEPRRKEIGDTGVQQFRPKVSITKPNKDDTQKVLSVCVLRPFRNRGAVGTRREKETAKGLLGHFS